VGPYTTYNGKFHPTFQRNRLLPSSGKWIWYRWMPKRLQPELYSITLKMRQQIPPKGRTQLTIYPAWCNRKIQQPTV
jgi:hypothetical protein